MTTSLRTLAAALAAVAALGLAGCSAAPDPAPTSHSAKPSSTPTPTPDPVASGICSNIVGTDAIATAMDVTAPLTEDAWSAAGSFIGAGGDYCAWSPAGDDDASQRRQLYVRFLPAEVDPATTAKAGSVTCDTSAWHSCTVVGADGGWVYSFIYGDQSADWKAHRDAVGTVIASALTASTPAAPAQRSPIDCGDTASIPLGETFDGHAVAAQPDDKQVGAGLDAAAVARSGYTTCVWKLSTGLMYAPIDFAPHSAAWFDACAADPDAEPVTVDGVKRAVAIPGTQSASRLCVTDGVSTVVIDDPHLTADGAAYQWTDDLAAAAKVAPAALALASR